MLMEKTVEKMKNRAYDIGLTARSEYHNVNNKKGSEVTA